MSLFLQTQIGKLNQTNKLIRFMNEYKQRYFSIIGKNKWKDAQKLDNEVKENVIVEYSSVFLNLVDFKPRKLKYSSLEAYRFLYPCFRKEIVKLYWISDSKTSGEDSKLNDKVQKVFNRAVDT